MIEALARKSSIDLRKHSVSLISTDGLNFDAFLPLFGESALQIPVSVVTDADPPANMYPVAGFPLNLSANAEKLRGKQDTFMKAFFAQKTLEYDMALEPKNIKGMLKALEEIHPTVGKALTKTVEAGDEAERAKLLFSGMFERGEGKTAVQKGAYGQALADVISDQETEFVPPQYIAEALQHVTKA